MVSICTVMLDVLDEYFDIFAESICDKLPLVKEIIVAKIDADRSYSKTFYRKDKKFCIFGCPFFNDIKFQFNQGHSHAYGLHECIDCATQEYLLFTDPDLFFYSNVDEVYYKMMKEYNLNVIGVSHHNSVALGQVYFPCLVNLMIKKSDLPDDSFLKGELKLRPYQRMSERVKFKDEELDSADGKWLIPGPLPNHYDKFPNPNKLDCVFDTGVNFFLLAKEKNWKWLAFQTMDCHKYTTKYSRGSIRLKQNKNNYIDIVYHAVGGTRLVNGNLAIFKKEYNMTKGNND